MKESDISNYEFTICNLCIVNKHTSNKYSGKSGITLSFHVHVHVHVHMHASF